jgi:transglutaminase-like putative cysteine protease
MIYDVRHVTAYAYASPVPFARHLLRLTPVGRRRQVVEHAVLTVEPEPTERADGRDFFGNAVTHVALDAGHEGLVVSLEARVVVVPPTVPDPEATPPFEAVRAAAFAATSLEPAAPAHFLYPSRLVGVPAAIRDYAARSFPPGRPVLAGAIELMGRIKADFVYEPGVTDATTLPLMAFDMRRGVCQDFAHVMIAGLRSLGLPASYVSGYLRTVAPPGGRRLAGADATHAWAAVWCGGEARWVGLDPTNAVLTGIDHIVLAVGRDYADVAPVAGVIVGAGDQRLDVSVDVVPLAADEPGGPV